MSIVFEFEVNVREFSGWTDPEFPSGYWSAAGLMIGDATGGTESIQVNFSRATAQRNSQFYSLEQLAIWQIASNTDNGVVSTANWDLGRGSSTNRIFHMTLSGSNPSSPALATDLQYLKGLFLGRQADPLTSTTLTFIMANVVARQVNLRAEGYIWGARAAAVAGGPQRPLTGLYR